MGLNQSFLIHSVVKVPIYENPVKSNGFRSGTTIFLRPRMSLPPGVAITVPVFSSKYSVSENKPPLTNCRSTY